MVNIASQNRGATASVVGRRGLRDTSAAAAVTRQPPGILQVGVRACDRIWGNAQIDRELPYGGKRIARTQFTALDEFTKLGGNLLKRRYVQIGIDGQDYAGHEVRDRRDN